MVLFSLEHGCRGYKPRCAIDITQFDAIAQLSGNGDTCAVTGFPRRAVSYDDATGESELGVGFIV